MKKITKRDQKREDEKQAELAAIELRLADLAQGAAGWAHFDDGEMEESAGLAHEMGIPDFFRYVCAVKVTFEEGGSSEAPALDHAFWISNLENFADRFHAAAEHLWEAGARA